MQTQTFPAGAAPRVTITGGQGALNIEFWDQRDFAVDSVAGGAISQADAALVIHDARGDMRLRVPAAAEIAIENHHGDLRIATIDGSVRLRATGPILGLGSIGGNLTLADAPLGQEALATPIGSIAIGGSARIELPTQAALTIDAIVGGGISGRGVLGGPGMRTIVYGDGAARLRLTVGGHLTLV